MKRTIPIWRQKVAQLGDEEGSVEWARSECERYHCPFCGEPLSGGSTLPGLQASVAGASTGPVARTLPFSDEAGAVIDFHKSSHYLVCKITM